MSAASSKRSAEDSTSAGSASKRAKTVEFNSTQIIDGDIESNTEWALNLAEKIAAGDVVKLTLSKRLQSCFSQLMKRKEEILEKAATELTLVEMDKKEFATVTDKDCLIGMTNLSTGLLHVLSVALLGDEDAPEPLTRLLAPVDDQSNLSLFRYKGGCASEHEDRGLLTIVYAPDTSSLVDRHGQCVTLAADEVAVWSGCALQAATAVPSYEKAVIHAAKHSIEPQAERYSLVFRLRGSSTSLLDPARFLSPEVLVRQRSQGCDADSSLGAFYRRFDETHKSVNQPAVGAEVGFPSFTATGQIASAGAVSVVELKEEGQKQGGDSEEEDSEEEEEEEEEKEEDHSDNSADNSPINICIKDQSGEKAFFAIKRLARFGVLARAFAKRKGVKRDSLRFTLDCSILLDNDTPHMLKLEDNDQIDVVIRMLGD